MRSQIVIPARLASTRLSEKLLRRAGGKSILQHTYESASRSELCDSIVVAVDDPRLADEVTSFGGKAIMTSLACASGTDRIAEVASQFPDVDVFVNVQGDEPEIDPAAIDLVTKTLLDHPDASIATVATPIRDPRLLEDPSCVKIVMAELLGKLWPCDLFQSGDGSDGSRRERRKLAGTRSADLLASHRTLLLSS